MRARQEFVDRRALSRVQPPTKRQVLATCPALSASRDSKALETQLKQAPNDSLTTPAPPPPATDRTRTRRPGNKRLAEREAARQDQGLVARRGERRRQRAAELRRVVPRRRRAAVRRQLAQVPEPAAYLHVVRRISAARRARPGAARVAHRPGVAERDATAPVRLRRLRVQNLLPARAADERHVDLLGGPRLVQMNRASDARLLCRIVACCATISGGCK